MSDQRPLSRRALLHVTGAGAGALTLAACGGGGDELPQVADEGSGSVLAQLSDVPVGSALSLELDGRPVLVAQPTAGSVVGFDAECPHQGCRVRAGDGLLQCPCHGSEFDVATGAVLAGPADAPLTPLDVVVVDGRVELA